MMIMNNTENLKNAVSSIDDETLRCKVEEIISTLGISESAISNKIGDISFIRNAVMNMSEQDICNMINTVGAENAQNILRVINGK
jgi:hypothetical protein